MKTPRYPKPAPGDTVLVVRHHRGNPAPPPEQCPATVTKVGRRYFTTNHTPPGWSRPTQIEWDAETWMTRADRQGFRDTTRTLYPDAAAFQDRNDRQRIHHRLRQLFDRWSITEEIPTETLRQIDAILPATLDRHIR
jgi:hypothetical protein